MYRDLDGSSGGTISWVQLADRVAVTFQAVPIFGDATQINDFQVELFFDGRIRITYLGLNTPSGLVGLSAGVGQPASFIPSDFTTYATCASQPGVPNFSSILAIGTNLVATGTGGTPGGGYSVLVSSNLTMLLSNWVGIRTSLFDGSGNFSFTNTINPRVPLQFYRIRVP